METTETTRNDRPDLDAVNFDWVKPPVHQCERCGKFEESFPVPVRWEICYGPLCGECYRAVGLLRQPMVVRRWYRGGTRWQVIRVHGREAALAEYDRAAANYHNCIEDLDYPRLTHGLDLWVEYEDKAVRACPDLYR